MFATPGPILTILGALVLTISFVVFNSGAPSSSDVDAIIEAKSNSGTQLKAMLGMVCGLVMCIAGGLWAIMSLNRSK